MGAHSNVEEWTVVAVNKTKAKIKAGGVAFGVAVGPYDVSSVELAGAMGFDFVVIDCEHDLFDPRGAEEMIRAADVSGMTPIVRIMNNPELILHLLDAGAQGVWVARVNSIDDAKRVVNAAKFHPEGTRTIFFRSRGGNFGLDVSNARQWTLDSNRETMIGCIIEGIGGVNVLSDILAMPEVDFIDLGPLDLAHSMGWPEQKKVDDMVAHIISESAKAGKAVTGGGGIDALPQMLAKGRRMITVSPKGYFQAAAPGFLKQAREVAAAEGFAV